MSYEPTIIIKKADLEKNRSLIENAAWDYIPKKKFKGRKAIEIREELEESFRSLALALDYETVKFPEIELVLLGVEFTFKNQNVRELLDELKICYRLDNA